MLNPCPKGFLPFIFFLLVSAGCFSQTYTITTEHKDVDCTKGAAAVKVENFITSDSYTITWSNGQTNVTSINELPEGDYNVNIKVKNTTDTTRNLDSTLAIKVEKTECEVFINNHFTPNGDLYNDTWSISRTEYYPNFELFVFNKWGQRVHSQKGTYTPWDGTWNSINVPDGTYYYIFYYEGSDKGRIEKGDVTILR